MNKLQWQTLTGPELAHLLQRSQVRESRAVGASTVYRLVLHSREHIAVALPDGQALVIEQHMSGHINRRKRNGPETET